MGAPFDDDVPFRMRFPRRRRKSSGEFRGRCRLSRWFTGRLGGIRWGDEHRPPPLAPGPDPRPRPAPRRRRRGPRHGAGRRTAGSPTPPWPARVGVAESTCADRVRGLRERGVVRGIHADIDPRAVGSRASRRWWRSASAATSAGQVEAFRDEVVAVPGVLAVYNTSGANDYLVHVAAAGADALRDLVLDHLANRPGRRPRRDLAHLRGDPGPGTASSPRPAGGDPDPGASGPPVAAVTVGCGAPAPRGSWTSAAAWQALASCLRTRDRHARAGHPSGPRSSSAVRPSGGPGSRRTTTPRPSCGWACTRSTSRSRGLTWEDAVVEALCFGWIDSRAQRIDEDARPPAVEPRKPTSMWATINVPTVERLIAEGRMHPAGLAAYEDGGADRTGIYSFEQGEVALAEAARGAARGPTPPRRPSGTRATPSYRKICAHWVASAKREATRERRLAPAHRRLRARPAHPAPALRRPAGVGGASRRRGARRRAGPRVGP